MKAIFFSQISVFLCFAAILMGCGSGLCPLGSTYATCRANGTNLLGVLDTSFGTGGLTSTDFGASGDQGYSMSVLSDGKIVMSGAAFVGASRFAINRYTAQGILDTSFGTAGLTTTPFPGSAADRAFAMVTQSDGKFVLGGSSQIGTDDFALARYTALGILDSSFGTAGRTNTDFAGSNDAITTMALQADGKIVVGGYATIGANRNFALARYTDGTLDTSFGTAGRTNTDFGGSTDQINSLVIQPDGKIVAGGFATIAGDRNFAIARYNADGSLDTGFGTGGIANKDFAAGLDQINALILQADGKILVAGFATISAQDFALARYNTDGTLDTSFGTAGATTTGGATTRSVNAITFQQDGKILIAGACNLASNDFAIARYTANGMLDAAFGSSGMLTTDFEGSIDIARAIGFQPNGKIILGGVASTGGTGNFAIARYY